MKNLLLLLILVCLGLVGCDGKDRVHLTNTQVLEQHKLLDSFSEKVKYFPKEYNEIATDTLLSNGFRVKIKSLTDMEKFKLINFRSDGINHKHHFRELINIVEVYKDEKLVFKEILTDNFLNQININYSVDDDYIKNVPYINDFKSLENDKVNIILSHCIPKTVNCPDFELIIDKNGDYELKEIN